MPQLFDSGMEMTGNAGPPDRDDERALLSRQVAILIARQFPGAKGKRPP
jgi:hypothetical protein